MFKKILYPVDLSGVSSKIQPYVKEMAEKFSSEIHIIYVAHVTQYYSYVDLPAASIGNFENEIITGAEKKLNAIADIFKNQKVVTKTLTGHPGLEIINYIKETGIELVIMGHSSTGIERAIFGSVAGHVVKYSPVPVMVISPEILKHDGSTSS